MGVIHKPDPGWCSHYPVLIEVLRQTNGSVLEMGMGVFSTSLLHVLCEVHNRELRSYDSDGRFVEQLSRFQNQLHNIGLVENWDDVPVTGFEIALVDHKPAQRRKVDLRRLVEVPYVIVHDTQPHEDDHLYDYASIYPLYKYRYDYTKLLVHTSILSNKHDVKNIFHNSLG